MIWLHALLALGLLAGLYVLIGVLVIADLAFVFVAVGSFITHWGDPHNQLPAATIVAVAAGVVTAWAMLGGVLAVSRGPAVVPPGSVRLAEDEAPRLWDMITKLAERVRTPAPDELYLIAEANAKVSEETRLLGLIAGTRRMYVGLPLLVGLSNDELEAVLCHELGHYSRRHTRLGAVIYRGYVALHEAMDRMAIIGSPLSWYAWLFNPYARLYFRLTAAVRRRQELEADAAAVDVVGPTVTTDALRSAYALPAAWDEFLDRFVEPTRQAGCVPDDPFAAFRIMLDDPAYARRFECWRQSPPECETSPYDSHPSLKERLRTLNRSGGQSRSPRRHRSPRAIALISNDATSDSTKPSRLIRTVRRSMFAMADTASLPYQDWVDTVATLQAAEPANQLVHAVRSVRDHVAGLPESTLAAALDLLESGHATLLVMAMLAKPGPVSEKDKDQARAQLIDALVVLIGHALVAARRAEWKTSWTGEPSRLASPDISVDEIRDLVSDALDRPTQVSRLHLHLRSLNVDVLDLLGLETRASEEATQSKQTTPAVDIDEDERSARRKKFVIVAVTIMAVGMVATIAEGMSRRDVDRPPARCTVQNDYCDPLRYTKPNPDWPPDPSSTQPGNSELDRERARLRELNRLGCALGGGTNCSTPGQ